MPLGPSSCTTRSWTRTSSSQGRRWHSPGSGTVMLTSRLVSRYDWRIRRLYYRMPATISMYLDKIGGRKMRLYWPRLLRRIVCLKLRIVLCMGSLLRKKFWIAMCGGTSWHRASILRMTRTSNSILPLNSLSNLWSLPLPYKSSSRRAQRERTPRHRRINSSE